MKVVLRPNYIVNDKIFHHWTTGNSDQDKEMDQMFCDDGLGISCALGYPVECGSYSYDPINDLVSFNVSVSDHTTIKQAVENLPKYKLAEIGVTVEMEFMTAY